MRPSWDNYWLEIASVVAKRSTCPRLAVGCVITLNNKILTTGYNGATSGEPHCTEIGCHVVDNHCKRVIHAEMNALCQLGMTDSRMRMYVTHEPCEICRTRIIRNGIREVFWSHAYRGLKEDPWRYACYETDEG